MTPKDVERFLREGGEPAPYLLPPSDIDTNPTAGGHYRARLWGDSVQLCHHEPPVQDEEGRPVHTAFGIYNLTMRAIERYMDTRRAEEAAPEPTDFPESEL